MAIFSESKLPFNIYLFDKAKTAEFEAKAAKFPKATKNPEMKASL